MPAWTLNIGGDLWIALCPYWDFPRGTRAEETTSVRTDIWQLYLEPLRSQLRESFHGGRGVTPETILSTLEGLHARKVSYSGIPVALASAYTRSTCDLKHRSKWTCQLPSL